MNPWLGAWALAENMIDIGRDFNYLGLRRKAGHCLYTDSPLVFSAAHASGDQCWSKELPEDLSRRKFT
jgi:hypothetical protein